MMRRRLRRLRRLRLREEEDEEEEEEEEEEPISTNTRSGVARSRLVLRANTRN